MTNPLAPLIGWIVILGTFMCICGVISNSSSLKTLILIGAGFLILAEIIAFMATVKRG